MPTANHPDPSRDYTIGIVGGGIGGLCTAIGLVKHGISVSIYEAASAFAEIGAGVSLGPNAKNAMTLLDPDIFRGFEKVRTNNGWPDRQKFWFSFRQGDDPAHEFGKRFLDMYCPTGQSSVHRARFLDELAALIPQEVAHFGKRLTDIKESPTSVQLHFEDGTTATHSAVICCDGIKSIARPIVLGANHPASYPVYSGKYVYRGLIPMSEAIPVLGEELAVNSQNYLGHGSHILTFPIEHGKTLNVVACSTSKDVSPNAPNNNEPVWEGPWIRPMDRAAMFSDFQNWSAAPLKILSMMKNSDVWALFDQPDAPTYTSRAPNDDNKYGRIALLGDSAHASTPHNGNGAAMAIEDALILTHVLQFVHSQEDLSLAFQVYEEMRIPRTQKQVRTAREAGLLYEFEDCWAGDDLVKVKEKLERSKLWLWEYDLVEACEEAEKRLRELQLQEGTSGKANL